MQRNHKLTSVIKGRSVWSATSEPGKLVIIFDDQSTMTVKTSGVAASIAIGSMIKAVLEEGHDCALRFEDGSSLLMQLADPGASIAVRDRGNAVEYLG